jgi:hypothetical protein
MIIFGKCLVGLVRKTVTLISISESGEIGWAQTFPAEGFNNPGRNVSLLPFQHQDFRSKRGNPADW